MMIDNKIRIRFVVEYRLEPSLDTAIVPPATAEDDVATQFNEYVARVQSGAVKDAPENLYLEHIQYLGCLGDTVNLEGAHTFFGIIAVPRENPLGHLFLRHGPYGNGDWPLDATHKGALTAVLSSALYFPPVDFALDAIYSVVITSIQYDDQTYTVGSLDATKLRGPGGGTVRFFEEVAGVMDELRLGAIRLYSGPGGGTIRS